MGYFKIPDWIVDSAMKELTANAFVLLVFYCRVANKQGKSWYTQAKISEVTNLSIRQIKRALRVLLDSNFVTAKVGHRKASVITLSEYLNVF